MRAGQRWIGLLVFLAVGLVIGCALKIRPHSAVEPASRERAGWMARHESFNQRARQGEVDLVFIGDSITQGWEGNGKEVWEQFYAHRKAMNLGIGGDRTQHVLWRLDHGNLEGISPKAAIVMIGTNNHRDNSAQEIGEGIVAIVEKLRSKRPRMEIVLLAIFPRGERPNENREMLAEASRLASKVADGTMIHYLDIGGGFVSPDETISREIMPDFLHLSPRGYEIWAEAIEGKVSEVLGER